MKVVVGLCAVVLCLVLLNSSPVLAIDCDTLPPRFAFQLTPIDTFSFAGGNDCWGWVAPNGTEYALFGGQTGIGFVNVTTGTVSDFESGPLCTWRDIKTYRHYAYEVSECGPGLRIWDLNYLPDSVHLVGTFTNGATRCHNLNIDTATGYAYLVRQNYTGFRVLNLANPESPSELSGVVTGDMHDMYARHDTVWAAEGNNHAFSIWDMTNKAAPVRLAHVTIPGGGYVHNIWPTDDGRFIVTTEETAFKTVKIWNTSDLASIFIVAEYVAPSELAHNAHVEGNYVFLSHYESGVAVLDITSPECPVQVALYDNYLAGESPNFNGCWGVYPHAQTGHVYASTIEGGLYIFSINTTTAEFFATPTVGPAPLSVTFHDTSPSSPTAWNWNFGDGGVSTSQNPSHSYGPGLYNVSLTIQTSHGQGNESKVSYVTALAETLKVADTTAAPGTSVVWDISYHNNVPLTEIKLPVQLSGVPAYATFDSISTVGCRTNYFELKQYALDSRSSGRAAYKLTADVGGGAPPLAPGDGPIAQVYFTVKNTATPGQQIVLTMPPMGVSQHSLDAFTITTEYIPNLVGGSTTVDNSCSCPCQGDPICDANWDVLDVVETVNNAFRATPPTIDAGCPHVGRSDIDCSGEINLVDVVLMVNVVFRNADPQTTICNPCNP